MLSATTQPARPLATPAPARHAAAHQASQPVHRLNTAAVVHEAIVTPIAHQMRTAIGQSLKRTVFLPDLDAARLASGLRPGLPEYRNEWGVISRTAGLRRLETRSGEVGVDHGAQHGLLEAVAIAGAKPPDGRHFHRPGPLAA